MRASEKNSISTNSKSTTLFPASHRRTVHVTPKSPKGWLKTKIFSRGASDARVIAIIVCPCVCLSVCVTHAGIVSKRLNIGSRKQHQVIARDSRFLMTKFVGGRPPSSLKLRSKWPIPFQTAQFRLIFAHNASTVRAGEKVQLALIESRPRAFQRAIDEQCTLPLSPPKGGTKRDFVVFASTIQLLSNNVCYKVSLCEHFQRQSCSYIIPLSNGP